MIRYDETSKRAGHPNSHKSVEINVKFVCNLNSYCHYDTRTNFIPPMLIFSFTFYMLVLTLVNNILLISRKCDNYMLRIYLML